MYRNFREIVSRTKTLGPRRGEDDALPTILHTDEASAAPLRKGWARMIQKIYKVDPLICPKCSGAMRILASIEDQEVIRKILNHLGLWSGCFRSQEECSRGHTARISGIDGAGRQEEATKERRCVFVAGAMDILSGACSVDYPA